VLLRRDRHHDRDDRRHHHQQVDRQREERRLADGEVVLPADEMFSVVWANSQNASTPKMMPNRTRSFPTNRASPPTRDDRVDMALSFMHA
jgi:hypothetical protein